MRRFTLFLCLALMWTLAMALVGIVQMPKTAWDHAARIPAFVTQIIDVWVVVPLAILLVLVGRGPTGGFLQRLIYRGRTVPPDRERWGVRTGVIVVLFMIFGQAWVTVGLILLWRRRQLPWVAQVMQGPHYYGIPDPHHLFLRLWPAAGGVLLAWVGNGMPKLLSPFRGAPEPYGWGKMIRACGWLLTLGGLATVASSLFIPNLRTADLTSSVILASSVVATLPIWAIYRFLPGHFGVTPTKTQ